MEVSMKRTFSKRILYFALALTLMLGALTFAICAESPATAEDFNNAVTAIKNADDLEGERDALANATDILNSYKNGGGSETDEEIKEAYAYYTTAKPDIEERVGYCDQFIEAVSAAVADTARYSLIRKNFDIALALRDENKIDMDYESVALYARQLDENNKKLIDAEEICAKYVDYAAKAASAKTWKEANDNVTLSGDARRVIDEFEYPLGIEEYAGFSDAENNVKKAKEFMSEQVIAAMPFCNAVSNISRAKSIPIGIAEAYELLDGVDTTSRDAASALSNLKKAERNYNNMVKKANEAAEEAAKLGFGILFSRG